MPANCGQFLRDRETRRAREDSNLQPDRYERTSGQTAEPWVHRGARQPYLRSLARIGAPFVRHLVRFSRRLLAGRSARPSTIMPDYRLVHEAAGTRLLVDDVCSKADSSN